MTEHPGCGVIIVDHGSRREASNQMLHLAVEAFSAQSTWDIVEPAHMELAQPNIATAFRRCVERGARKVVVFPYFLSPGRHWSQDIPQLVKEAAAEFPGVDWMVTAPFGLHPGMMTVISERITHCLSEANANARIDPQTTPAITQGSGMACDVCRSDRSCAWQVER